MRGRCRARAWQCPATIPAPHGYAPAPPAAAHRGRARTLTPLPRVALCCRWTRAFFWTSEPRQHARPCPTTKDPHGERGASISAACTGTYARAALLALCWCGLAASSATHATRAARGAQHATPRAGQVAAKQQRPLGRSAATSQDAGTHLVARCPLRRCQLCLCRHFICLNHC